MTFLPWLELLALAVMGIFSVWGIFDKVKRQKETEKDKMEVDVINLLKEQINALDRKVTEQAKTISALQEKIIKVSTENQTMREILQDRDSDAVNYRKAGFEAMKRGEEVSHKITKIEKNIERLIELIDKKIDLAIKNS